MSTHVLVLNCGSSSLKFALLDPRRSQRLLSGTVERLGSQEANLKHSQCPTTQLLPGVDHRSALQAVFEVLEREGLLQGVGAVGHRVVHGGEQFSKPTLLSAAILEKIKGLNHLAPLHNPVNILGIEAAQSALPHLPQVAVFDTAFHQSMPEEAYRYAVPDDWYEQHGVRRYGFHGTSHRYVAEECARRLERPLNELALLTAHLGAGCSATAIWQGQSVDTTMGMTPLSGLIMATRSGDLDPGVVLYMSKRLEGGVDAVDSTLNRKSGLQGLSGSSSDMRTLLSEEAGGSRTAARAVQAFCYRAASSLAALAVALPRLDALVFTGGIGEHSAPVRGRIVDRLWQLGVRLDEDRNGAHGKTSSGRIDSDLTPESPRIYVIPTDEEQMIASETLAALT